MAEELTVLWQEAEAHLLEFERLDRRMLTGEDLQEFSDNVTGEIHFLAESFEGGGYLVTRISDR